MARDAAATVFVTGTAGFIGTELIKLLVAQGHHVVGLTPSPDAARRVRRLGGMPVTGDLRPGKWQDEAAADWVFHLPPQLFGGPRVSRKGAASIARTCVSMDANLLDAVSAGTTRRIVYVANTSWYGATGTRSITEDEPRQASAWRSSLTPAIDRLDGYVVARLPIVTAFAGWVYGNASWFREQVIDPITAGRRVVQFGKAGPWVSAIHVHDCARALVHLAERGEVGSRYFLVNTDPIRIPEFAETFARLAHRPLRVWRMPAAAARFVVGPILADHLLTDAVFSNIRLRGTGFRFQYPTLEQGLEQVIGALHE